MSVSNLYSSTVSGAACVSKETKLVIAAPGDDTHTFGGTNCMWPHTHAGLITAAFGGRNDRQLDIYALHSQQSEQSG